MNMNTGNSVDEPCCPWTAEASSYSNIRIIDSESKNMVKKPINAHTTSNPSSNSCPSYVAVDGSSSSENGNHVSISESYGLTIITARVVATEENRHPTIARENSNSAANIKQKAPADADTDYEIME